MTTTPITTMSNDIENAIIQQAYNLGMSLPEDAEFLDLAEQSIYAPLPAGWQQLSDDHGELYYYNERTGDSTFEHPLDERYRRMFERQKAEKMRRGAVPPSFADIQQHDSLSPTDARSVYSHTSNPPPPPPPSMYQTPPRMKDFHDRSAYSYIIPEEYQHQQDGLYYAQNHTTAAAVDPQNQPLDLSYINNRGDDTPSFGVHSDIYMNEQDQTFMNESEWNQLVFLMERHLISMGTMKMRLSCTKEKEHSQEIIRRMLMQVEEVISAFRRKMLSSSTRNVGSEVSTATSSSASSGDDGSSTSITSTTENSSSAKIIDQLKKQLDEKCSQVSVLEGLQKESQKIIDEMKKYAQASGVKQKSDQVNELKNSLRDLKASPQSSTSIAESSKVTDDTKLIEENGNLRIQLTQKETQLEEVNNKLESLQKQMDNTLSRTKEYELSLKEQNETLRVTLTGKDSETKDLKATLGVLRNEMNESSNRSLSLESELRKANESLMQQLQAKQEEVQRLSHSIKDISTENHTLLSKSEALKREKSVIESDMEKTHNSIKQQLQLKESKLQNLEELYKEAKEEISNLRNHAQVLLVTEESMRKQAHLKEEEVQQIREELILKQEEMDSSTEHANVLQKELHSENQNLKQQLSNHETIAQDLRTEIETLSQKLESSTKQYGELEVKLRDEHKNWKIEIESARCKFDESFKEAEEEKLTFQNESKCLRREHELLESSMHEANDLLESLRRDLNTKEKEVEQLKEELIAKKQQIGLSVDEVKSTKHELTQLLNEQESISDELRHRVGTLSKELDTSMKQHDQLKVQHREENATLQLKIKSLQNTMDESMNKAQKQESLLQNKVDSLAELNENVTQQLLAMEKEVHLLKEQLIFKEQKLENSLDEIKTFEKLVRDEKTKVDEGESLSDSLKEQLVILSEKLDTSSREYKKLQEQFCEEKVKWEQSIEEGQSQMDDSLNEIKSKNKALMDKNDLLRQQNERLEANLQEKQHEILRNEESISTVKKQVLEGERLRKSSEIIVHDLTTELEDMKILRESEMNRVKSVCDNLESRLKQRSLELESKESAINALTRSEQMAKEKFASLTASTAKTEENMKDLKEELLAVRSKLNEASANVSAAEQSARESHKLMLKERERAKALNERVIELQGNIRVFCRIRPLLPHEKDESTPDDGDDQYPEQLIQYQGDGKMNFHGQDFEYDRVFEPDTLQGSVYEEVSSAIESAIDGEKVCIFAYGQTGSGKTHTMEGPKDNRGVNFRALSSLFDIARNKTDIEYNFSVSILEVYNEIVQDVLNEKSLGLSSQGLNIRMGREQGVFVEGLTNHKVSCTEDVERLMSTASLNRKTANNNVNVHSSRSHLVLTCTITGQTKVTGTKITGLLSLIDLAGSERLKSTEAEGARLEEAKNINRSLSALGDVVNALGSGSKHVPYRNSKLTYLLQESLRANAKVLMFVNISPSLKHVSESSCSLKFAERCRAVQLGKSRKDIQIHHQSKSSPMKPSNSNNNNSTSSRTPIRNSNHL